MKSINEITDDNIANVMKKIGTELDLNYPQLQNCGIFSTQQV